MNQAWPHDGLEISGNNGLIPITLETYHILGRTLQCFVFGGNLISTMQLFFHDQMYLLLDINHVTFNYSENNEIDFP